MTHPRATWGKICSAVAVHTNFLGLSLLTLKQSSIAAIKLFGNLFLGHLRQVEGTAGEAVAECLEADYGEDDIVDAVEVATVSGGHDSPVLDVSDDSFYNGAQ